MKITVQAEYDDGTTTVVVVDVNSGSNPRFWTQGLSKGLTAAQRNLLGKAVGLYGGHIGGVHVVSIDNKPVRLLP